ncbi:MAG: phosphatase PAP2 family protein [Nocardioides sp.]
MSWQGVNHDWFLAVNHLARVTPAFHALVSFYAEYGVVLFAVVLLGAWWSARRSGDPRRVAAALWAPAGALLAIGLNQPLVRIVHEPRPHTVFPNVLVLVARGQDFSFPSDHAVMAGAVTVGVLLVDRRLGVAAAFVAILMGFSLVYVGAHFPLDVVAGVLFGGAVTLFLFLGLRPLVVLIVTRLARTSLRPVITATPGGFVR